MIFGVTRKSVATQQRYQESIAGMSTAIAARLYDIERTVQTEDCTKAWRLVFEAAAMLTALANARTRAGLPSEGPFGVQAARRLAALRDRVGFNCGDAIAYERRR